MFRIRENNLKDTGENEPKCAVYFRPGARSYQSFGLLNYFLWWGEVNSVVALRTLWLKFACGQVSSPRLYRLKKFSTSNKFLSLLQLPWDIFRLLRSFTTLRNIWILWRFLSPLKLKPKSFLWWRPQSWLSQLFCLTQLLLQGIPDGYCWWVFKI